MNPPWLDDSESEDDEDWMAENLLKYKHLFTYKMEHLPLLLKIHPEGSKVVIVSQKKTGRFEVLVFKLPAKLMTIDPKEEGLLNSRELSVIGGVHLEHLSILDVDFVPGKDCSIMILGDGKLEIYELEADSDLLALKHSFRQVKNAKFIRVLAKEKVIAVCDDDKHYVINCADFTFCSFVSKDLLDFDLTSGLACDTLTIFNNEFEPIHEHKLNLMKSGRIKVIDQETVLLALIDEQEHLFSASLKSKAISQRQSTLNLKKDSKLAWACDGKFLVYSEGKKVQIVDWTEDRLVFAHECSKKASKVTAVEVHPKLNRVIICADDSKAVQAFWF